MIKTKLYLRPLCPLQFKKTGNITNCEGAENAENHIHLHLCDLCDLCAFALKETSSFVFPNSSLLQ